MDAGFDNGNPVDAGYAGVPSKNVLVRFALDGDTILVTANASVLGPDGIPMDGRRVRLLGVDAPEIEHDGTPADCFGDEAMAFTAGKVEGRIVTLSYDPTKCQPPNSTAGCRDDFDRLLAYVSIGDEVLNESLLSTGHARAFGGGRFRHRDSDRYDDLERQARSSGAGLWTTCR